MTYLSTPNSALRNKKPWKKIETTKEQRSEEIDALFREITTSTLYQTDQNFKENIDAFAIKLKQEATRYFVADYPLKITKALNQLINHSTVHNFDEHLKIFNEELNSPRLSIALKNLAVALTIIIMGALTVAIIVLCIYFPPIVFPLQMVAVGLGIMLAVGVFIEWIRGDYEHKKAIIKSGDELCRFFSTHKPTFEEAISVYPGLEIQAPDELVAATPLLLW